MRNIPPAGKHGKPFFLSPSIYSPLLHFLSRFPRYPFVLPSNSSNWLNVNWVSILNPPFRFFALFIPVSQTVYKIVWKKNKTSYRRWKTLNWNRWIDIIEKKRKKKGRKEGLQPIYKFCINLIMMQLYEIGIARDAMETQRMRLCFIHCQVATRFFNYVLNAFAWKRRTLRLNR